MPPVTSNQNTALSRIKGIEFKSKVIRQKRIIALMNSYSQGKSGGDVVFTETYKRLPQYEKWIITSKLGEQFCLKERLKAKFIITTQEKKFERIIWIYFRRILKALSLKISFRDSDILVGTSDFLPDTFPAFWWKKINRQRGKRIFWIQYVFHLLPPTRRLPHLNQLFSFQLIKKEADLIIVDNNLLKEELIKQGFGEKRLVVNYPGIDLDYFRAVNPASQKYEAAFIAQLRPAKGIFDLIKIWQLVCQKRPGARLAIIGQGQKETISRLKKKIRQARLENNIFLLGFLPNDEAFALIAASKVFVFPSHEEGFGIAPLEAQALGVPVVAWHLPIFDEIFPRGMVKINKGDIEKFANAVLDILENKKKAKELSAASRINVQKFAWQISAQRLKSILSSLS